MFPLPFFVCRPMVNRCRVHSFIVSRYIHSNGLCRCFPFPAYFYWLWTKKNNNNGNLIPLEIGSFPFYPDCNIYSRSMFGVRLDIFYMYEYWKLFELRGKSISLTSMARTTHARKCLWIVQITTMRAINHSLSERLKCKHNNTCTHTHTHFSLNRIIFIVIDGIIILVLDRIYTWCGVDWFFVSVWYYDGAHCDWKLVSVHIIWTELPRYAITVHCVCESMYSDWWIIIAAKISKSEKIKRARERESERNERTGI